MVDNLIDGVYANVTRINPETLSVYARTFLKTFREEIKQSRTIDKNLGNLIVKTIIKYHNDTGESLIPLMTELTTVSFFVIEGYRRFYNRVVEYLLLGTIFGVLTVIEDKEEIKDIIEQTVLAILTNPIFEFTSLERLNIAKISLATEGYIEMLDKLTHRFAAHLPLIRESLKEGMIQALEICNASQDEINMLKNDMYSKGNNLWGRVKFFLNFAWPKFNVNFNSTMRWLNNKTGIEFWPEEKK